MWAGSRIRGVRCTTRAPVGAAEAVGSACLDLLVTVPVRANRCPRYHNDASPPRGSTMQLKASTRTLLGKRSRRLHGEGKLAGVVYGHNTRSTPLVMDRLEFQKVFIKSGRTHLVDLVVDGDRAEKVLVREIQTHPRRLGPIHVDFYQVSLEEEINVEVPVHLTGESAAVKRGDADVLQPIHMVRIECLP